MGNILKTIFLTILALNCQQLFAEIEIKALIIQASPEIQVTTDLAAIDKTKGVDFLSAPPITTMLGTKAKSAITREFAIDDQDPITVGIELEIKVNQTAAGLNYIAKYELTEIEGFVDPKTKKLPICQTITIPFNGLAKENIPILIDAGRNKDANKKRYIYLLIKKV